MDNPNKINQHAGTVIRDWRKERGLSQSALAEKVGVHQTTIAKLENNERSLDFSTVVKIAQVLNIPWDSFYVKESSPLEDLRQALDAYLRSAYVWSRALWNSYSTLADLDEQREKALDLFVDEAKFNADDFTLEELEKVIKTIAEIPHDASEILPAGDEVTSALKRHTEKYEQIKAFRDKLDHVIRDDSA